MKDEGDDPGENEQDNFDIERNGKTFNPTVPRHVLL